MKDRVTPIDMASARFEASSRRGAPRRSASRLPGTSTSRRRRHRIGLALAGGGFLGAAYELGALAALGEAIEGLDLTRLDAYVGVSAGSYVAAGLANGLSPLQLIRLFVESDERGSPFDPTTLLSPAYAQYWHSLLHAPIAVVDGILGALRDRRIAPHAIAWRALERAGGALPLGLLDAEPAQRRLAEQLSMDGRSNDFRDLRVPLRIVATDIDTGQPVEFGVKGFDHVPISRAVAASSAVPGLFAPVNIDGRHYVDGALTKTMHASVALREGADLVICVNPLVPLDAREPAVAEQPAHATLPGLLSQSIRTVIRSRVTVGMQRYQTTYPRAVALLFEPGPDDAQTFKTSIFSLASRRRLCEHAYQRTRADLRARATTLQPVLARFGLSLNRHVLDDMSLRLVSLAPSGRLDPRADEDSSLKDALARLRWVLSDLDRIVHIGRVSRGTDPGP